MTLRSRFFAMTHDRQIAKVDKAGLRGFREGLLAGAAGRVLEIGGGTGNNLPFYGPAVESLTITEPEIPMLRRLERLQREVLRRTDNHGHFSSWRPQGRYPRMQMAGNASPRNGDRQHPASDSPAAPRTSGSGWPPVRPSST
jgi:hypothetical protein